MPAPAPEAPVVRWIALAGAGGAAAVSAIDHFDIAGPWASIALMLALLAVVGIATLGRVHRRRSAALLSQASLQATRNETQHAEFAALQKELELHKQLERELLEAKQAAEAATLAKGEFLATMSHEIRTPLNGIIPMLDLLQGSPLQPGQAELVQTAATSAQQLLRIVDDILDYSRLEADKLQLESVAIDLRELLDSVMRMMERAAEGKGLRLGLRVDPGLRTAVRGDPTRLRQVLGNLVGNAIKFTERGSVALQVTRLGETATHHSLRFEVRDTGIGIAAGAQAKLFNAFSQADASTTRLYGGTGLGLAICKRIVQLMGGRIGVESEPGRGSLFWFEVPLLKAVGDLGAPKAELAGTRLLVLAPEATLYRRLGIAAPNWGVTARFVTTTQEALDRLRDAASRGPAWAYQMLVADLGASRSTALALHRNIQRIAALDNLRIVYLQGDEALPPELRESGRVLVAPRQLGETELRMLLAAHLASDAGATAVASPASSAETPAASATGDAVAADPPLRGRVLLVEDNPVNLMVSRRLLTLIGLECDAAENGQQALDRLAGADYDLVLMDCQMPVMDGYTATRAWRASEASSGRPRLPIVAMTANAMAGDRQRCLDAGMDDYLAKPVTRPQLESTLRQWLGGQAETRREETPGAAPATREPAPALDRSVVEDLRSLMGEEFLHLVRTFLADAPAHIARLDEAAERGDIAGLVAPAHTIKSASANLGALALSRHAKLIELGARHRTLADAKATVGELRRHWLDTESELRALL